MKRKRAYGYIRSAVGETSDIQLQTIRINDYCNTKGIKLVKIFIDAHKSGMKPFQNNGVDEMLSKCRKSDKVDAIIATDSQRISRSYLDYVLISKLLEKKNIELILIDNSSQDSIAEEEFIKTMMENLNILNKVASKRGGY